MARSRGDHRSTASGSPRIGPVSFPVFAALMAVTFAAGLTYQAYACARAGAVLHEPLHGNGFLALPLVFVLLVAGYRSRFPTLIRPVAPGVMILFGLIYLNQVDYYWSATDRVVTIHNGWFQDESIHPWSDVLRRTISCSSGRSGGSRMATLDVIFRDGGDISLSNTLFGPDADDLMLLARLTNHRPILRKFHDETRCPAFVPGLMKVLVD